MAEKKEVKAMTTQRVATAPKTEEYALGENRVLIITEQAIATSEALTLAAETKLAGQRGLSVDEKIDTLDVSNKDSGGRKIYAPGRIETKIAVDGLEVYGDASLELLKTKLQMKETVFATKMDRKANTAQCAPVLITSFKEDAKDGSEVTYAFDLVLCGDWVEVV
ncbi:MAG: phage tail tube protein [Culicoidibacterales bacterium]